MYIYNDNISSICVNVFDIISESRAKRTQILFIQFMYGSFIFVAGTTTPTSAAMGYGSYR